MANIPHVQMGQARLRQLNEEVHEYCALSFDEARSTDITMSALNVGNFGTQIKQNGGGKVFEKCSRLYQP